MEVALGAGGEEGAEPALPQPERPRPSPVRAERRKKWRRQIPAHGVAWAVRVSVSRVEMLADFFQQASLPLGRHAVGASRTAIWGGEVLVGLFLAISLIGGVGAVAARGAALSRAFGSPRAESCARSAVVSSFVRRHRAHPRRTATLRPHSTRPRPFLIRRSNSPLRQPSPDGVLPACACGRSSPSAWFADSNSPLRGPRDGRPDPGQPPVGDHGRPSPAALDRVPPGIPPGRRRDSPRAGASPRPRLRPWRPNALARRPLPRADASFPRLLALGAVRALLDRSQRASVLLLPCLSCARTSSRSERAVALSRSSRNSRSRRSVASF